MSNQNYTTTIQVNQTPNEVFDAVNNVAGGREKLKAAAKSMVSLSTAWNPFLKTKINGNYPQRKSSVAGNGQPGKFF